MPPTPASMRPWNASRTGKKKERWQENIKKLIKNDANLPKECPGGVQNGPKMDPKSRKIRWIAQSGYQMAPKTPLPKRTRRFLAIFGSPLGAQKSPKIDFFPKKPFQGTLFHRFLRRMSFSSIFRLIFSWFWMKNQWKKIVFFKPPLHFFQHGDPHETL